MHTVHRDCLPKPPEPGGSCRRLLVHRTRRYGAARNGGAGMPSWLVSGLHLLAPVASWVANLLPALPRWVLALGVLAVALVGGRVASGILARVVEVLIVAAGAAVAWLLVTHGAVVG